MKLGKISLVGVLVTAASACGGYGDTHHYKLDAQVLSVLSCDKEANTCQARVSKSNKTQYSEVWLVQGTPQQGDVVSKTCSFKVVKQAASKEQIGASFSSRDTVEKTLDNTNCLNLAQIKQAKFWQIFS